MTDLDAALTEENAQKVLARALELQAQSASALTVAQIRAIALEMSIPEAAVDQALLEYRTAGTAELSAPMDAAAASTSRGKHWFARSATTSLALVGGAFLVLMISAFLLRLFP